MTRDLEKSLEKAMEKKQKDVIEKFKTKLNIVLSEKEKKILTGHWIYVELFALSIFLNAKNQPLVSYAF